VVRVGWVWHFIIRRNGHIARQRPWNNKTLTNYT
jgi:hypothetical protein